MGRVKASAPPVPAPVPAPARTPARGRSSVSRGGSFFSDYFPDLRDAFLPCPSPAFWGYAASRFAARPPGSFPESFPASSSGRFLCVAATDRDLEELRQSLTFFKPSLDCVYLPARDALPYERLASSAGLTARRVRALGRLQEPPSLVVTTSAGLVQKAPSPVLLWNQRSILEVGTSHKLDELGTRLGHMGYRAAATVYGPGEFARRGDILDLFPGDALNPYRVHFFDDTIERIDVFDPLTQRRIKPVPGGSRASDTPPRRLELLPVSEILVTPETLACFRQNWHHHLGGDTSRNADYQAITEGLAPAYQEDYLAFFYPRLVPMLELLPTHTILWGEGALEALRTYWEHIADQYEARCESPQRPPPPEGLYLTPETWGAASRGHRHFFLSRTVPPDSTGASPPTSTGASTETSSGASPPDLFTASASIRSEPEELGALFASGRPGPDFTAARLAQRLHAHLEAFAADLAEAASPTPRLVLAAFSETGLKRLETMLGGRLDGRFAGCPWRLVANYDELCALPAGMFGVTLRQLGDGFAHPRVVLLTEQDLFGARLPPSGRGQARPAAGKRRREAAFFSDVAALEPGSCVVHLDHGVGRYEGITDFQTDNTTTACLRLRYAENALLYVPVLNIDLLSPLGGTPPVLDRLGSVAWEERKARVKKKLLAHAQVLLDQEARRHTVRLTPAQVDPTLYEAFCSAFPHPETEDQAAAMQAIERDLAACAPSDRLICGDVGFGKTELAMRASFLVALDSRQVLVLVPTTLLARQHLEVFQKRFEAFPIRIGALSRLTPRATAAQNLAEFAQGTLDILIGTHALLSKKLEARRLGLVVIDEEQHFGVKQKNRLRALSPASHILTLTATPIPRSLQFSLSGLRALSLITTPPPGRLAVRSFVGFFDQTTMLQALRREFAREGQAFVVCPFIRDLGELETVLKKALPEIRIGVVHGKTPAAALETCMTDFVAGKLQLLLSTAIIESGLDIPKANTMVVVQAEHFGLAQLHQLRGRIGRSNRRGYCYFFTRTEVALNSRALKRLQTLSKLDALGSGFSLASQDLDIRGAGNLLGEEQSGHIREVGLHLYQKLLSQAVAALKNPQGPAVADDWTPELQLGVSAVLPETYIEDLETRTTLYHRCAHLANLDDIRAMRAELADRFGPPPLEAEQLLRLLYLKLACKELGIQRLSVSARSCTARFRAGFPKKASFLQAWVAGKAAYRFDDKGVLSWYSDFGHETARLLRVQNFILKLQRILQVQDVS